MSPRSYVHAPIILFTHLFAFLITFHLIGFFIFKKTNSITVTYLLHIQTYMLVYIYLKQNIYIYTYTFTFM